jgi:D-threo-aldose 1-dehydrogenase
VIPRGSLVFGGAPIGGLYAPVRDETAAATLQAAWDAGIRAFDTAPHYGVGLSERRIGDFLAGRPRAEFVVCTKVGRRLVPATGPVDGADQFYDTPALSRVRDYTADGALRSLEDSLRRLRLDRADIALIHDPDDHLAEALDGAYSALARLRADGTLGAIGVGVNSTSVAEWFVARCDLDCVLVAVLAAGVFNGGILAVPADGARYDYAPAAPAVLARARRIAEVCARYEIPVAAAAVRYVLRHPAVTAAVVGARTPQEIRGDAGYLGQAVPEALWAELAGLR